MKRHLLFLFCLFGIIQLEAQRVAVNETGSSADVSAMLDVSSTTKGLLIPRMTGDQRAAIVSPANGLIVYQTDNTLINGALGLYLRNNGSWKRMARAEELGWTVSGSNLYTTTSGTVGIGTSAPHASAVLDLSSTSRGLLVPRMTGMQRSGIMSPPAGLTVFQTDGGSSLGYWFHDGTSWQRLAKANELTGSDSWTIVGEDQFSNVDGNVGIGVTSGINDKLFLNGDMMLNAPGGALGSELNVAEFKIRGAGTGSGLISFLKPDSTSAATVSYSWLAQALSLGNSESDSYMRFYNDGNIGIGTDAVFDPALSKLQIKGGTSIDYSDNNGYLLLGDELGLNMALSHYEILARNNGEPSSLYLQHDGGVVRMGNGGIATGTKLQITDGTIAGLTQHGYLIMGETFSESIAMDQNSIQARNNGAASRLELQNYGGGFRVKVSALVVSDDNTNVGVGVLAPTSRLHVGGSSPTIQLQHNGDDNGFVQLSGDNIRIGTNSGNTNGQFVIRTNGGDHVFVNGSGNMGIGTSSPSSKLHVAGHSRFVSNGEAIRLDGSSPNIGFYHNSVYRSFIAQNGSELFLGVNNGKMHLDAEQIAIGSVQSTADDFKLAVSGKIICEELKVELVGNWPDYVFAEDYPLTPLHELKTFIEENNHLPNIPKASEIQKDGFEVGEMNRKLLEKVEELTLYILQQQEEINALKAKVGVDH